MSAYKTGYVGGSFDLFHRGHVELFRKVKRLVGRVVVAVNSDAFHEFYRGEPPVVGEQDRLAVVLACRYVDHAFIVESHEKQPDIIAAWKPDYIVHGSDWTGESLIRQLGIDREFLLQHNIEMMYLPYTEGISSSSIKERVRGRPAV